MCIGMNIFDENGECYFISPLNHSSQEKRTATGKHAFAGRYIDSTLTQEVIELRKELSSHAANQLLHFTRKDSSIASFGVQVKAHRDAVFGVMRKVR